MADAPAPAKAARTAAARRTGEGAPSEDGTRPGPVFAMSLRECHLMGTFFASHGWDEQRIGDWLLEQGYSVTGLTARRIGRAYRAQLERG